MGKINLTGVDEKQQLDLRCRDCVYYLLICGSDPNDHACKHFDPGPGPVICEHGNVVPDPDCGCGV